MNVETYRPLLFSIAYRMTGSAMEAEDIVQDAYVRYQGVDSSTIDSPKAYLTTIVTRLSLNHLNSARVQREQQLGPWLPEPVLTANRPELLSPAEQVNHYETISMAFLVLLEKLTPVERAVFVLREVFDYDYAEVAQIVGKSQPACRQIFSRARKHISANRPRFETSPDAHKALLNQFIETISTGDLDGLTAMLAQDAVIIPEGTGVRGAAIYILDGRERVAQFIMGVSRFTPTGFTTEIEEVNGKPGLIIRDAEGKAFVVVTIDIRDGLIHQVQALATPAKIHHL